MNVSDKLLDKYFKGQCSPEELLIVNTYLDKNEELPDHLLSKCEWDETTDAKLSDMETEAMFKSVKQQTIIKSYRIKLIKITAAAAIAIAMLSIGFLNLNEQYSSKSPELTKNVIVHNKPLNIIRWKSVVNFTEQNQSLILPDNSVVNIYPGGEVRYTLPFVNNKREVFLKGKGFFEVAKDKKHPFIVYAKGISTTALGTSFTITALDNSKFIKVQLHTGKVWVKDADSTHRVKSFGKILTPGKELVYNTLNDRFLINNALVAKAKPAIIELNFTQAPLVEVFASLQKHYKVNIIYDPAGLQEMSFTGDLKLTQSIDAILDEITSLNKLKYIKRPEGYLISK